ncbi:putative molybdenum carrier protein [Bythopirellula polymerisocia]|uniref:Putative molybdenum carrier n=1 Tax=Bythopirellula polymerisocia TaxID=2528003 RepID=A0A5C6D3B8_9BACT|nr:putative molybdenum carrier protein [Bythopirellula polymerisocia]TWU30147.1 putative molybdenum carrier [Bythopirellula polymerisocia]
MGCDNNMELPLTIVSGGQTGADRAALDFAIRLGLDHAGWCPRGRRAEDGPLDLQYDLQETSSPKYDQRTRWNVRDSDATLVITAQAQATGGSALTLAVADREGKPCLHIAQEETPSVSEAGERIAEFILEHQVERLNVAGPRASQEPDIGAFVSAVLSAALTSQTFAEAD